MALRVTHLARVLAIVCVAPALHAEPTERHHIELSAAGGPAFPRCTRACSDVKTGYAFGANARFRVSRSWAMGARLERGWFPWSPAGASDQHATTTLAAVGFRYHAFRFDRVDPYLELDAGSMSVGATGEHDPAPRTFVALVPAVGVDVYAMSLFAVGLRGGYEFGLVNQSGYAEPKSSDAPALPGIAGVGTLSLVVTFGVGPQLVR